MVLLMICLFVLGYVAIATEHQIHVNKAASALILCSLLWTIYIFYAPALNTPVGVQKTTDYVTKVELIEGVGEVAEILFFLMGAMTIVELIDVHGGFNIITRRITTKNKKTLLFILTGITFVMSAVLDNLTTTIVIVMLLRKLVQDQKERWYFAAVVILAANAGGAFSPIGDVTTIMLWVKGNVTTSHLIPELILPSIVAAALPMVIMSRKLHGSLEESTDVVDAESHELSVAEMVTNRERNIIFYLGIGALVFVPIFKAITHLPPYLGVSLGLGVLWVYTEIMYHEKGDSIKEEKKARIQKVVKRIDMTTILFFLGILMAVNALSFAGILRELSEWLDQSVGNIYAINIIIGVLSSIVDNVPLVAGAMKMYEVDPSTAYFAVDGAFWLFLAYCAGVGGSILIVGSAAGVVVMGLEKVSFGWYLKEVSLIALLGYLAGALTFIIQDTYIVPLFN
ncbi:MAG: sodium:proton antiporter NhaD [Bacteroidales bacterium]|jgi:Na+/H+ antiporter NhaD/arsenite permease-like protein|nr:sodium:proton antiporter NhaD [Paludibacteraceae bacterium]MBR6112364.1 sodium:proton antiporter NhaD [Paludibacteraceae bacterium]MDO4524356.1 sodium:proton antiporter NhaD [Bacteroidales bacterium]MEE0084942.1 sodium:proton antiporter NhaD [Paludibacteraceae bacterium]